MAKLWVGESLEDADVLWRYLSLEKFIDLVESKTLFFAPLAWHEKRDPFEGYLPQAAMEAIASISTRFRDEQRVAIENIAKNLPIEAQSSLLRLQEQAEAHVPTMKALYKNIVACLMVNCWYKSEHESEGMWGLYSRDGVAIKTTVGAIKSALADNKQGHAIGIGTVKYVDFSDKSLKPSDCLTEDHQLIGMIKRIAYAHEREVRMYITRGREKNKLELQEPVPEKVAVNLDALLEAVVISPFASDLTERSVHAIGKWGGIDSGLVSRSGLLDDCEYLLDAYK